MSEHFTQNNPDPSADSVAFRLPVTTATVAQAFT